MTKQGKTTSLAALAEAMRFNAEKYERSWRGEQFARQLRDRRNQLDELIERAKRIEQQRKVLFHADPKARIPKRRLSPAVKKLEKLESTVKIDVSKILEPEALDAANLKEAFQEAEETLLETWQKFAKVPKEIAGAEELAEVPELQDNIRKLKAGRAEIEALSSKIPTATSQITAVRKLIQELTKLGDALKTHGYDEEVLGFLSLARTRGVSLSECLNNKKIRQWLESRKNAAGFLVFHRTASAYYQTPRI